MKRLLPITLLLILAGGCAKTIRVGAIDKLDSDTYNTLTVAQVLLDNAKVSIIQGKLPDTAKLIVNNAGKAYNALRDSWLAYRANPVADTSSRMTAAALEMSRCIADLRGIGVKQ